MIWVHDQFAEIDRKRRSAGISEHALCRKAQMAPSTYWRLKTCGQVPRSETIKRLAEALADRPVEARQRPAERNELLRALFNSTLAVVAASAGVSLDRILNINTKANRPRDLNWCAVMRLRHVAMYLIVTTHSVPAAQLARAMCISKQRLSKMLREIEDSRDDPAYEALLDRIADVMNGSPS